ncbi:unnamed protein product [Amoebophrya sp. A25]|nr:unnamed protein product [Amoebophrya sp. A25]|eukprot:GSA25T00022527001.1
MSLVMASGGPTLLSPYPLVQQSQATSSSAAYYQHTDGNNTSCANYSSATSPGPGYSDFAVRTAKFGAGHLYVLTPYGQGVLESCKGDMVTVSLACGAKITILRSKVQFHQQHAVEARNIEAGTGDLQHIDMTKGQHLHDDGLQTGKRRYCDMSTTEEEPHEPPSRRGFRSSV